MELPAGRGVEGIHVAVIGAGVGGLATASRLAKAGCRYGCTVGGLVGALAFLHRFDLRSQGATIESFLLFTRLMHIYFKRSLSMPTHAASPIRAP